MAGADLDHLLAVPLQVQRPAFIATDRATLSQLEKGFQDGRRLAHAAVLQLTVARGIQQDQALMAQLAVSLNGRNWAQASRTTSEIQQDLPGRQDAIGNPEALMDPLWGAWIDATLTYAITAQRYALAAAQPGQSATVSELGPKLSAQAGAIEAGWRAARDGAAAWQKKTIRPLLDHTSSELAPGPSTTP